MWGWPVKFCRFLYVLGGLHSSYETSCVLLPTLVVFLHFLECPHPTECPNSKKKILFSVYLTQTLRTLKAQLYLSRSRRHPLYFRCLCCDFGLRVFIVLHHFRDHILDPLWWRVIVGLVWSLRFLLQRFHLGPLHRNRPRWFMETLWSFAFLIRLSGRISS